MRPRVIVLCIALATLVELTPCRSENSAKLVLKD
jgi:hypothetical protein